MSLVPIKVNPSKLIPSPILLKILNSLTEIVNNKKNCIKINFYLFISYTNKITL
jgi:hypothetical protein